jgi:hypothetical protein
VNVWTKEYNDSFILADVKFIFSLFASGLPDGFFFYQKSQFGKILEGLALEDVGTFYGQLVNFRAIWYILRTFGIF